MQRWKTIASTYCKVDSTFYQRHTLSLYQRCTKLKVRCQILFHFQRQIKFWSPFFVHTLLKIAREANTVYSNGSRFKKICGIVIRICKLSSVCLPYCIYFVLFAKLKQCADWYKSQLSNGFTRNLLDLQITYSHLRITLLQRTIMTFSRRFPKFLCSSAIFQN